MGTHKKLVEGILIESALIGKTILEKHIEDIDSISNLIITAYKCGGNVLLCGNGGSAADAQHIAAELVGKFNLERRPFPAIALTTNSSTLTAIANDYGYKKVFSRQVEAFATTKDVVIGISTTGNSVNVVEAIKKASSMGVATVGLSGCGGGILASIVDIALIVPSRNIPRVQEAHILIGHIICEIVEKELVGV